MEKTQFTYTFIDTPEKLHAFGEQNKGITSLTFDTEFVGEKRFQTLLCLIQVSTEFGNYLIDPLSIKDLGPFLDLLEHPDVMCITHAGENDYRLLNDLFGIVPKNLFDTQVAAGFCGYRYPFSYSKLVESELGDRVKKDYSVTNWEARPVSQEQLDYALFDILHLPDLYKSLKAKLDRLGRFDWVRQELHTWETDAYYVKDPDREILTNNLITNIRPKQQIFLMRVLRWRTETARRKNQSREMVFSSKLLSHLVRAIPSGKKSMINNRRLPDNLVRKYGDMFLDLYGTPASAEEKEVLKRLPKPKGDDEEYELILDMLYLMVKYKCLKEGLSVQLVFPRGELNKMKVEPNYQSVLLQTDWRSEFLGNEVLSWLQNRERLEIGFGDGRIELKLK